MVKVKEHQRGGLALQDLAGLGHGVEEGLPVQDAGQGVDVGPAFQLATVAADDQRHGDHGNGEDGQQRHQQVLEQVDVHGRTLGFLGDHQVPVEGGHVAGHQVAAGFRAMVGILLAAVELGHGVLEDAGLDVDAVGVNLDQALLGDQAHVNAVGLLIVLQALLQRVHLHADAAHAQQVVAVHDAGVHEHGPLVLVDFVRANVEVVHAAAIQKGGVPHVMLVVLGVDHLVQAVGGVVALVQVGHDEAGLAAHLLADLAQVGGDHLLLRSGAGEVLVLQGILQVQVAGHGAGHGDRSGQGLVHVVVDLSGQVDGGLLFVVHHHALD
ncbi:MAG: hypothetical protein Q4D06_05805 [Coriobacteriia bacterium]|nr:hypothetical protein [Coriobacteriia bacterium]